MMTDGECLVLTDIHKVFQISVKDAMPSCVSSAEGNMVN